MTGIAPDLAGLAVDVTTLHPLPGNPRRGDVAAVMRSYAAFGQRKPIVVRRSDRTVLAGNHQLLAAVQLEWPTIAVVWVDDDEATALAYAAADNRTGDLGDYDNDLLGKLLETVKAAGDAELLAATGYQDEALKRLLRRVSFLAGNTDPDDAPPLPTSPISRPGDLWLCGPHRVLCGDARVELDVANALGGRLADMVWTDPPYGVDVAGASHDPRSKRYRTGSKLANDALDPAALGVFLTDALGYPKAFTRPGGVWMVAAPGGDLLRVFANVLGDMGIWRHTIVWVKDQFVFSRCDYHYRHEMVLFGWVDGAAHRAPPDQTQDTVWEIHRPPKSLEHPTMKPAELVARGIGNHTIEGDQVLDPFGGSGTTLIAAHGLRRLASLIEIDPRYVDVICRRYQAHTGEQPIHAKTGKAVDFDA